MLNVLLAGLEIQVGVVGKLSLLFVPAQSKTCVVVEGINVKL